VSLLPRPLPRRGLVSWSVVLVGLVVSFVWCRRICELTWAISGTRGSSGLGSVNIEQIDRRTFCQLAPRDNGAKKLTLGDGQSGGPLVS